MEDSEKNRYIEYLLERLDEKERARELSDKRFEEERAARKEADRRVFELLGRIDRMGERHQEELQKLQKTIEYLTSAIHLNKKNRFATTSQKARHSSKKDETPTRDEEREDYDGTTPPASANVEVDVEETTEAAPDKEDREYRKGMKYNMMLGVSAQKYFKMFFSAIIEGRRDYARSTLSLA